MVSNPATYRRVKYRNAIKEAVGYPAGEVWAMLEKHEGSHAKITVCIGPKNEDIELDERTEKPINLLKEHVFHLPLADFKKFIDVLQLMKKQKSLFSEALRLLTNPTFSDAGFCFSGFSVNCLVRPYRVCRCDRS
jgi:hypothetical protein